MIGFIISAIKIIFVLGFLVLIHEGGHFLVAKFFKVQVNEFSIGFGKELISTKKKETKYVLRMIPFGGYVSMLGEEERSSEQGSFSELPVPKRIAIVAAGGLVNIVFGIITYFVLVSIVANNFYSTKIDTTKSNYAAEISGIQEGDEIISINNKRIHLYSEVNKIVQESNGDSISVFEIFTIISKAVKIDPLSNPLRQINKLISSEKKLEIIAIEFLRTMGNEKINEWFDLLSTE